MLSSWKLIEWWNENKNEMKKKEKCEEEKKIKRMKKEKMKKIEKKNEINKNAHCEMWIKITRNVDVTRVMNAILRIQMMNAILRT